MATTVGRMAGGRDQRWSHLDQLLSRPSPFPNESGKLPNGYFEPSPGMLTSLRNDAKILVIGAGGLGCEILKNLSLSGLTNISVIDLDSIDISNLNRQFLFRMKDVGNSKAVVAAEFIKNRVPGCIVTPYHAKIQDFDEDFYRQFRIIISGLDNIEARRWLNAMLVDMIKYDEDGDIIPESIIPMIDGGTEGFKGQARVIIPKITSCFECTLELFPPQKSFPLCTIRETPRLPEHCITYAYLIEWEKTFGDRKLDADNPNDMQWVYHKALERAEQYGIVGVTYFLTIGVVKNVIPAVASTNAIISAACVNETLKLLTYSSQTMNTYFMYMGSDGIYTSTFEYKMNTDCAVCSAAAPRVIHIQSSTTTLDDFVKMLAEDSLLQIKTPFITCRDRPVTLFATTPPQLAQLTAGNLEKLMSELLMPNEFLLVTDPALRHEVTLQIALD